MINEIKILCMSRFVMPVGMRSRVDGCGNAVLALPRPFIVILECHDAMNVALWPLCHIVVVLENLSFKLETWLLPCIYFSIAVGGE